MRANQAEFRIATMALKFRSLRELALKCRSLRELAWCSMRWTWRWDNDARPRSSITPTKAASTTSFAFGERCRQWGIAPSMGSVGDCYDNAMAESFFATLECELLDRTRFQDHRQAQREIFEYIEGWYNPHRRHQGLGDQSPIHFERSYQQAA